jgi:4-amino-4-deoxy-L-arabinose transferase-like glycosyltransferase
VSVPPVRDRFRRLVLAAALAAAVHALVYAPLVGTHVETDSVTYRAAASSLLDGSYSTPLRDSFYYVYPVGYFEITGLRVDRSAWDAPERQAFRPPGYPLLLAAAGGGVSKISEWAAIVLQAALVAVSAWLLAVLVRRWWGATPALVAVALYALDPWSKRYAVLLLSETMAGLMAVACAYAFTRAWQERSARWWAAAGALAASLTLVRVVFVLAVPLVVLAALLRSSPAGARVRGALAAGTAASVLLVPWLAWTTVVTERTVLTAWGEGYNLLWAAHGEGYGRPASSVVSSAAFQRDLATVYGLAPTTAELRTDPNAHPRYLARADARLRDRARSLYGDRLQDEPLQVLWEFAYRAFFLWNAHEDWYQPSGAALRGLQALDWALIVLATAGIALALVRGGPGRGIAVFLLAYTLVLSLHHVEARFAMPLRAFYLAFVGFALIQAWGVVTRRVRPGECREEKGR